VVGPFVVQEPFAVAALAASVTVANAAIAEESSELVLMLGESLQTTEAVGQYLRSLVIIAEAEVKYGVPELDIAAAVVAAEIGVEMAHH